MLCQCHLCHFTVKFFFSVDLPSFTSDIVMSIAKQQKQNNEECSNVQIRRSSFKN